MLLLWSFLLCYAVTLVVMLRINWPSFRKRQQQNSSELTMSIKHPACQLSLASICGALSVVFLLASVYLSLKGGGILYSLALIAEMLCLIVFCFSYKAAPEYELSEQGLLLCDQQQLYLAWPQILSWERESDNALMLWVSYDAQHTERVLFRHCPAEAMAIDEMLLRHSARNS